MTSEMERYVNAMTSERQRSYYVIVYPNALPTQHWGERRLRVGIVCPHQQWNLKSSNTNTPECWVTHDERSTHIQLAGECEPTTQQRSVWSHHTAHECMNPAHSAWVCVNQQHSAGVCEPTTQRRSVWTHHTTQECVYPPHSAGVCEPTAQECVNPQHSAGVC